MTKPETITRNGETCPNCGHADEWYPTGRFDYGDILVAQFGGPKAPIEMSVKGGHCLRCNYEEEAVYS